MSENKGKNLADSMRDHRDAMKSLKEVMPFSEYLDRVVENPRLAALAHERVYNMIISHGVDESGQYNFFKDELFGLDDQIQTVVDYFHSSAKRMDTRKRIFLLHGPVSSAKSTLVDMIKRGMEEYTSADEGALYGIRGCPIHEEPLHLVPHNMRKEIMDKYGVYVEGELCPHCRYRLQTEYKGDHEKFEVERIVISESTRTGIGTFLPSDPKSQDISELIGSINFSKIGEYGSESNPLAYTFDGELEISNRGIMEFIEMLKSDEKFLYVLLTLSQEQVIKAPRFPRIYIDVAVLAHTNEAEYRKFVSDPRSEALQDRIIKIDFPYNLYLAEEVKIYEKLLKNTTTSKHISPHTLEVASMVAVLTRLEDEDNPKLDLIKKMRLYNGEAVENFTRGDVRQMRESNPREGMEGMSPRYVSNTISKALIQDDIQCLSPPRLLKFLRDNLRHHTKFNDEERKRYTELISTVHGEYENMAEDSVKRAVVVSLEENCNELFQTYITNVEAYVNKVQMEDEFGNEVPVDEKLMRAIEMRMNIPDNGKEAYRRQILAKVGTMTVKGKDFTYDSDAPLRKAIDELIYEENKSHIRAITTVRNPGKDLQKRIDDTMKRLMEEQGYCEQCARELLSFVGAVFSRRSDDDQEEEEEEDSS